MKNLIYIFTFVFCISIIGYTISVHVKVDEKYVKNDPVFGAPVYADTLNYVDGKFYEAKIIGIDTDNNIVIVERADKKLFSAIMFANDVSVVGTSVVLAKVNYQCSGDGERTNVISAAPMSEKRNLVYKKVQ